MTRPEAIAGLEMTAGERRAVESFLAKWATKLQENATGNEWRTERLACILAIQGLGILDSAAKESTIPSAPPVEIREDTGPVRLKRL